jgi:hypothetical protein
VATERNPDHCDLIRATSTRVQKVRRTCIIRVDRDLRRQMHHTPAYVIDWAGGWNPRDEISPIEVSDEWSGRSSSNTGH